MPIQQSIHLKKEWRVIDGSESCFATASGMAAVFASLMCQLQAGDHVVSATALFGSCREIIKNVITRYGIEVSFVDGKNIESWKKAVKSNTKIFFFETPSNPCFELVDIEAVCKLAKANNIKVIVDNVLVSPVLQNPSKFGTDIIVLFWYQTYRWTRKNHGWCNFVFNKVQRRNFKAIF